MVIQSDGFAGQPWPDGARTLLEVRANHICFPKPGFVTCLGAGTPILSEPSGFPHAGTHGEACW